MAHEAVHIAETVRHDDQCEAFFVEGPNVMHPCGCEDRRNADEVRELRGIAIDLEQSEMLWLERIAARIRVIADHLEAAHIDGRVDGSE